LRHGGRSDQRKIHGLGSRGASTGVSGYMIYLDCGLEEAFSILHLLFCICLKVWIGGLVESMNPHKRRFDPFKKWQLTQEESVNQKDIDTLKMLIYHLVI